MSMLPPQQLPHDPRMQRRVSAAFGALILVQAAHSFEEYVGRLWESFPPARWVSASISQDLELGFLIANVSLVAFGLWCWLWPVRRGWASAGLIAWGWVIVETVNGVGHPAWALRQECYTPGLATAPVLLPVAIYLAMQLRRDASEGGNLAEGESEPPDRERG